MSSHARAPVRGYVICGEPRSGSNLLCQILASTDRLGRPRDFLNVRRMREKEDPLYPADPVLQLAAVLERGCSPNGIYGFKMFSARFDDIAPLDWTERLPDLRYIHLERRDLLGQAISTWRAAQTGQYRSTTAASGSAEYDRHQIGRLLAHIAHRQARWRRWFARNGIAPLALTYEEVVAHPQAAAERVARLMGVEEPVRVDPARILVQRQADDLSERWRRRFHAESRDLRFLDEEPLYRMKTQLRRARRRVLRQKL